MIRKRRKDMMKTLFSLVAILLFLLTASITSLSAQSTLPLYYQEDFEAAYVGAFRVPSGTNGSSRLDWAIQNPIAYNPANDSLFIVGHDHDQDVGEVAIPSHPINSSNLNDLPMAEWKQPMIDIHSRVPNYGLESTVRVGGLQVVNGELVGSLYEFYDGRGNAPHSHFVFDSLNLTTANVRGLFRVGAVNPGAVGGFMTEVPTEWRSVLGTSYITGQAGIAILGRTSSGPAAFGFDAENLTDNIAANALLYYPIDHKLDWGDGPLYNGNSEVTGVSFVPGTRSLLFFGSHGDDWCYGTPEECNDPYRGGKGNHAVNGEYKYQVWAYDLNDLVEVKNGLRESWDVQPYSVWGYTPPIDYSGRIAGGSAFDPVTRRLFISQPKGGTTGNSNRTPLIHVYQLAPPVPDTTNPVITNVSIDPLNDISATVTWDTIDDYSDSEVSFGTTPAFGHTESPTTDPAYVTSHSVTLTGLAANTTYHYQLKSRDRSDNEGISSVLTFTTPPPDVTPPVVSSVNHSGITDKAALISWTTEAGAVGRIRYGRTSSYELTPVNVGAVMSHTLTGLSPETTYYYCVEATDQSGNTSTPCAGGSFKTVAGPPDQALACSFSENTGTSTSCSTQTASLQGGASWIAGPTGLGTALQFDGSNDYVVLGDLSLTGNELTVMLWFKADDFGTEDARLISKATGTATPAHDFMLSTISSGGNMRLRARLHTDIGTNTLIASSGNLQSGTWTHVALVYNGSTMTIYKDGQEVGSEAKTGALNVTASMATWIGANPSNGQFFDGAIDEVRIFRSAKSEAQIQTLMEGSTPPLPSDDTTAPGAPSDLEVRR